MPPFILDKLDINTEEIADKVYRLQKYWVSRSNEFLITTGYYYNNGDGYVYLPTNEITPAPAMWDVDLIDPAGAMNCDDACII